VDIPVGAILQRINYSQAAVGSAVFMACLLIGLVSRSITFPSTSRSTAFPEREFIELEVFSLLCID
jgi:hypothetical protein